MITNPNTNCLAGFQCPECGSHGPFLIEVTTRMLFFDAGSDVHEDTCWSGNSACSCHDCGHECTVDSFCDEAPVESQVQIGHDTPVRMKLAGRRTTRVGPVVQPPSANTRIACLMCPGSRFQFETTCASSGQTASGFCERSCVSAAFGSS